MNYFHIYICLNPKYLDDGKVYYLLSEEGHYSPWFNRMKGKLLRFNRIAEYSSEQINDYDMIKRDVEELLTELHWI